MQLLIPSPTVRINLSLFDEFGLSVYMKRDDLIHPVISGNKYRKLHYNLHHAIQAKKETILTFGGAYSNHIAATATAASIFGLNSIGIIRGEDADLTNSTLSGAISNGMQIIRISREEYATKEEPIYLEHLHERFPNTHIIPEGGSNYLGVNGCLEILKEVKEEIDYILCAVGTGTSLAGLAASLLPNQKILAFPAIKGGQYLEQNVRDLLNFTLMDQSWTQEIMSKIEWIHDYSFGGFAKINDELINFKNSFLNTTTIELDLVYTAKMIYGFYDLISKNKFKHGSQILIYHSGGLQGNVGFNT